MTNEGVDPNRIIDAYIGWKHKSDGWICVNRTENGAQFTVEKRYSPLAFWIGLVLVVTVVFWYIGVIFWVLGAIDFLLSGKGTFYVDVRQMERELRARKKK